MNISGIDSTNLLQGISKIGGTEESSGTSFQDMLSSAIEEADNLSAVSSGESDALLSGQVDDVAQVMIDGTKTELALDLVIQVRNKVVDAYNEVMSMQV